jgi:hypothetical protein
MAASLDIVTAVLPAIRSHVLKGIVHSYGYDARAIGRSGEREAMIIGKAMPTAGGEIQEECT